MGGPYPLQSLLAAVSRPPCGVIKEDTGHPLELYSVLELTRSNQPCSSDDYPPRFPPRVGPPPRMAPHIWGSRRALQYRLFTDLYGLSWEIILVLVELYSHLTTCSRVCFFFQMMSSGEITSSIV